MFLDEINDKITDAEVNRLSRDYSHWLAVSKILYTTDDEDELKKMLVIEKRSYNRYYVLRRIHAHYNTVRTRNEREVLQKWNPKSPKKSPSDS